MSDLEGADSELLIEKIVHIHARQDTGATVQMRPAGLAGPGRWGPPASPDSNTVRQKLDSGSRLESQDRQTVFYTLYRRCVFLQVDGKTLHQQTDHNSLYCDTLTAEI